MKLTDGIPCNHPGCLNHITHPCEVCGRINGRSVKSTPILFSAEMIRAERDGRKTMTRRGRGLELINQNPNDFELLGQSRPDTVEFRDKTTGAMVTVRCPYGQVGGRLWVKETHRFFCHSFEFVGVEYAAGGSDMLEHFEDRSLMPSLQKIAKNNKDGSRIWRPSIFMPRWASRITLEITSVRVERLQEISEEDAKAEGTHLYRRTRPDTEYRENYKTLWESTNGAGSWDANPFVWVIEFKRVEGGAE